jgi:hypothetical protein
MTDLSNNPLAYNTANPKNLSGILASNGALHHRAVQAARSVIDPSE